MWKLATMRNGWMYLRMLVSGYGINCAESSESIVGVLRTELHIEYDFLCVAYL
jgi:hypothetical protein